jgi:hypothetical protein
MNRKVLLIVGLLAMGVCVDSLHAFNLIDPLNPWADRAPYWINIDGLDGPVAQAVQNAAQEWSAVPNSVFSFDFMGNNDDRVFNRANDQMTVMTVAGGAPIGNQMPCSGNTAGFSISWATINGRISNTTDGVIVLCLDRLNREGILRPVPWFIGVGEHEVPNGNQVDFGALLTHEMGHIARLDHSCDATLNNGIVDCHTLHDDDVRRTASMNYQTAWGDISSRTINADDIAGIQDIYGINEEDIYQITGSLFAIDAAIVSVVDQMDALELERETRTLPSGDACMAIIDPDREMNIVREDLALIIEEHNRGFDPENFITICYYLSDN